MALDFKDPTGGLLETVPWVGPWLFGDNAETRAKEEQLNRLHRAQIAYSQYRPEAMAMRREAMQGAMSLFAPMGNYVSQVTGQQVPTQGLDALFEPIAAREQRLRESAMQGDPRTAVSPLTEQRRNERRRNRESALMLSPAYAGAMFIKNLFAPRRGDRAGDVPAGEGG